jgi:hypothetical protein
MFVNLLIKWSDFHGTQHAYSVTPSIDNVNTVTIRTPEVGLH